MSIKAKYLTRDFMVSEFTCRCGQKSCKAPPMAPTFMTKLQALRDEWGKALAPTSGTRCPDHNAQVGGAPNSQHLKGNAADFTFYEAADLKRFIALAEKHGFGGIGTGKRLIHIDDGGPGRRWQYHDK